MKGLVPLHLGVRVSPPSHTLPQVTAITKASGQVVPGSAHLSAPVHSPHCWELREHQYRGLLHRQGCQAGRSQSTASRGKR